MRIPPQPPGLYRTSAEETLDGDMPGQGFENRTERDAPNILRQRSRRETDSTFTAWIGQSLHETYDAVSEEPLPSDLADLVRELERLHPVGRQ